MAGAYCGRCRYHETSLRDLSLPVSPDPGPCPGFSHYLRVSDPRAAGGVAIRAWRTLGPSGRADARAVRAEAWAMPGIRGGRKAFGRGYIRVLSSRSAAGYARRGISLLMLLHCRFSCVRVVFSMFSLLHFGFGPRCSSRYARRRAGGRSGRASIRIFGCTCRGMRGVASAIVAAVDVPDSSRL